MNEVTIVIPSFNMQSDVIRAVESVLRESLEVDIIVVDDGSEPKVSLPKEIAILSNVQLLRHDNNSGAGAARNTGVAAAQTEWVGFLDSDDVLINDTLGERFRLANDDFANNGGSSVIYGSGWIEPGNIKDNWIERTPISSSKSEDFASGCWYCPGSCIIGRRNIFLEHPFDERLSRLEDLDFGIRFGARGGRLVVFDITAAFIKRGKLATTHEVIRCTGLIKNKYRDWKKTKPKTWNALLAYLNLEIAAVFFADRKFCNFVYYLAISLYNRPRLKIHFAPGWHFSKIHALESDLDPN